MHVFGNLVIESRSSGRVESALNTLTQLPSPWLFLFFFFLSFVLFLLLRQGFSGLKLRDLPAYLCLPSSEIKGVSFRHGQVQPLGFNFKSIVSLLNTLEHICLLSPSHCSPSACCSECLPEFPSVCFYTAINNLST